MVPNLRLFFDDAGKVGKPLQNVLDVFANDPNAPLVHDGTIGSIRDATQVAWVKAGTIRAHIEEKHEKYGPMVFPLLSALQMHGDLWATQKKFDYVLLGGATVPAMERRRRHMESELTEKSVTMREIFGLASGRELGSAEKNGLYAECTKEHEAMRVLMAPGENVVKLDGTGNRADTVKKWLEERKPKPGSVLLISSNPWATDEWLSVRQVLPADFTLEVSAPATPSVNVSKCLDTIGRVIYKLEEMFRTSSGA